jgi:hypothetical protein
MQENGKKSSQNEDIEVPDLSTISKLGVLAERKLKELITMATREERTAVAKLLGDSSL